MAEQKQAPQLPIAVALVCLLIGVVIGWTLRPALEQIIGGTDTPGIVQPGDPGTDPGANPGTNPTPSNPGTNPQPNQGNTGTDPEPVSDGNLVWDGDDRVTDPKTGATVEFDGEYTSRDEVALYIYAFGDVPSNFISKTKARNAGWVADEGNLWDVLPGMSIGGGGFDNVEGELPLEYDPERTFKECDINYAGGYRGAERLVYSDDGYIFYTGDHYETFTLLYGPEE